MSAATGTLTAHTTRTSRTKSTLWRTGVVASLAAAVATQLFVVVAKAADVSLKVGSPGSHTAKEIPLLAFGQFALLWSLVGTVMAVAMARWAKRPARTFVVTTVVLTVVSFAAPVTASHTGVATKLVLSLSHVVAAAIVIPVLAHQLSQRQAARRDVGNA